MEVKGAPVLRYGGINYNATSATTSDDGRTVTYVYNHFYQSNDGSGFTADLSKISVRVVTDANGLQTVHMDVPDYVLPAFAPYLKGVSEESVPIFYYEALPVRLIFQVGLTAESEALDIKIEITDEARNKFIEEGYDINFGARPLKRLVGKTLEVDLSKLIIEGKLHEYDTVMVDYNDENYTIKIDK